MTRNRLLKPNLQTKTVLYFIFGLVGVVLSSLFIIRYFFLLSLNELERVDAYGASEQSNSVINMLISEQHELSNDWAMRDEIRDVLLDGDVTLLKERYLTSDSQSSLNNVDAIAFVSLKGEVVAQLSHCVDESDADNFLPQLLAHKSLSEYMTQTSGNAQPIPKSKSGLIGLGKHIWAVSLVPLTNSQGTHESVGWLVWAQNLSAHFPGQYTNLLIGNSSLAVLSESSFGSGSADFKLDKSDSSLVMWNKIPGFSGEPVAVLRTQIIRAHYVKGNLLFKWVVGALLVATVLIALVTYMQFKKKVVTRFIDLEKDIDDLYSTHQLNRTAHKSTDELEHLTHLVRVLSSNTSITQDRLKDTLQKFDALYQSQNIAMVLVREREIVDANETALKLLDYDKSSILHQPLDLLCPEGDQPECQVDVMYREFNRGRKHFEAQLLTRRGEKIDCQVETTLIQHEGKDAVMLSIQDQRESKYQKQLIEELSERDHLSALSNRRAILEKVDNLVSTAPNKFSFIYVCIPRLRMISEVFGHQTFDDAIKYIASIFDSYLPQFPVGRISEHEFVALIPNCEDCEEAIQCAQRLMDELAPKKQILGVELDLSCHVAILDPQITHESLDFLLQASIYTVQNQEDKSRLLYVLKVGQEMLEQAKLASVICRDLASAIRQEQIVAFYQPIVNAKTGEINGFEALARWIHPTLGMLSPAVFIPLTEQNNLEVELGESIIKQSCRFISELSNQAKNKYQRPLTVHVNLSATHFYHSQLTSDLQSAITEFNLLPGQLVIEITESMLMGEEEEVITRMKEIKSLGVQLALDDFGTGYSSFSTLCSFPLDIVELDKSYIDQLETNDRAKTLVRNIAKMAQELGLTTVAEGVETSSQVRKIRNWNIEEIQGFHFYKPLPLEEAMKIVPDCYQGIYSI